MTKPDRPHTLAAWGIAMLTSAALALVYSLLSLPGWALVLVLAAIGISSLLWSFVEFCANTSDLEGAP